MIRQNTSIFVRKYSLRLFASRYRMNKIKIPCHAGFWHGTKYPCFCPVSVILHGIFRHKICTVYRILYQCIVNDIPIFLDTWPIYPLFCSMSISLSKLPVHSSKTVNYSLRHLSVQIQRRWSISPARYHIERWSWRYIYANIRLNTKETNGIGSYDG